MVTPILKVNGGTSDITVPIGTVVLFEVTGACPGWGVKIISITDGYTQIGNIIVPNSTGYASMNYTITKTIKVYAWADCSPAPLPNSNSIIISTPPICNIPIANFKLS